MKAILVGMGAFGASWYRRLLERGMLAAVVEKDASFRGRVTADGVSFYTELAEAIEIEKPYFLVNVTPPHVHGPLNHVAFDYRLPVLCEKPISFDYEEAAELTRRSVAERIPFMIAENYRRFAYTKRLKQLLDEGAVGRISSMDVSFSRYHQVSRGYAVSLLEDIAVHHFDLMRYFTGAEGMRIFAKRYQPVNAWEDQGADHNLSAFVEMSGGIRVAYSGTITSRFTPTGWYGNWRIDGTEASVELAENSILLVRDGKRIPIELLDERVEDALGDFVKSLREGFEPESSAPDYMRTQALVHGAKKSSEEERMVPIELPHFGDTGVVWRRKEMDGACRET